MARYEGMDEILQRLSLRLGQETTIPSSPVASAARRAPLPRVTPEASPYRAATETLTRLRQEAERLRELLIEAPEQQLSPGEHDELLALLGKVMQLLRSCEFALQQTTTTFD